MNTENEHAAPQAAALEELHNFNEAGICEAPDVVLVADLPEHFAAEIRLARAADGWRVGFAYAGPPIGVSERGVLPALADAAYSERDQALAVGIRQLLAALQVKAKAKRAAAAVVKWAKERGIELSVPGTGEQLPENGRRSTVDSPLSTVTEPPPVPPTLQMLSVAEIGIDGANPRKTFDVDDLHELADSIAANGVLQPLVVRKFRPGEREAEGVVYDPEFRVIVVAGERRLLDLPNSVREILRSGKLTTAHGVALARFKAWPKVVARIAELAVEKQAPAGDLEEGLPFEHTLHQEKLIVALNYEDEIEEALGVDSLEWNDAGVPVLLAGQPWLFADKNPDNCEADLWAMDVPAWESFCAASKAEQQAKADAVVAAKVKDGCAPRAAFQVKLCDLNYKDFRRVEDLPAAVRKALPAGQIEEAVGYCNEATRIVRGEALALANKLERAATIESNRAKRAEIDAAYQAAVAEIGQISSLQSGYVAQLIEWACSDYQVGGQAEVLTDAAEALKLELPKGVKIITRGVADKLARFTPLQLLQLALTIRARAAWRVAHRDASPLPDDLKLFGAPAPAAKPVKKKAAKAA